MGVGPIGPAEFVILRMPNLPFQHANARIACAAT